MSIFALAILIVGCTRSNPPDSAPNQKSVLSSTPPFTTKEPESYQATRTITVTNATGAVNDTKVSKVVLARDGAKRREEYEAGTLGSIVYVETAAGRFVLLTGPRLYAEADQPDVTVDPKQSAVESEIMSPDYLLNESNSAAGYEQLGTEAIGGRSATKYRVITDPPSQTETFIWVDEVLGMPIASQSSSTGAGVSMRVSMELRNVRTDVDPNLFVLPADYHKVTAAQIRDMMRAVKE